MAQEKLSWKHGRRIRGCQSVDEGRSPAEVAEIMGVGRTTVYDWLKRRVDPKALISHVRNLYEISDST